jgi:ribose-phosphate pyrophosphokinase
LFPDASAERRFGGLFPGIPSVTCVKERDQISGQIIRHEVPEIMAGKRVLVADDLCDGGRTFMEVAEFIPAPRECDLYVTHGVFSNGAVDRLLTVFDRIWVSNSLHSATAAASDRVSILDVWV